MQFLCAVEGFTGRDKSSTDKRSHQLEGVSLMDSSSARIGRRGASFLVFVKAFEEEIRLDAAAKRSAPLNPYGQTARGWENITIESFLEVSNARVVDSRFGETRGFKSAPLRCKFATLLYTGNSYD